MNANNTALAIRGRTQVVDLDHNTKKEIVRAGNQIVSIGDIARAAMDEMSTNYVAAEQLAAQAVTVAHCLAGGVPQAQVSQAFFNTITQNYLHRMAAATDLANEAILRRAKESFQP